MKGVGGGGEGREVLVWMAEFSSNDIIIASITLQLRCCAISDYLVGFLRQMELVQAFILTDRDSVYLTTTTTTKQVLTSLLYLFLKCFCPLCLSLTHRMDLQPGQIL